MFICLKMPQTCDYSPTGEATAVETPCFPVASSFCGRVSPAHLPTLPVYLSQVKAHFNVVSRSTFWKYTNWFVRTLFINVSHELIVTDIILTCVLSF